MSFSISQFSSKVKQYGLAKSNLFVVEIGIPATIRNELKANIPVINDIRFFCRSVTLPEMDLITTDIQTQAFGSPQRRPQGMNFPILPATFMVDSEFGILKFFHRWTQAIINYDRSEGNGGVVNNQLPFEMGYKSEYQTTMKVTVYSFGGATSKNSVYEYNFSGVYPVNVGNVAEDWESHSDVMVLPVGFTYDTMKVTGAKNPVVSPDGGLGSNGLLSVFSSVNTIAQAIRGINRPRNIQDAINQITNVSTIVNAFK
jgi:hypothetical protein